jgi:ubiquinone biosynthesis protein
VLTEALFSFLESLPAARGAEILAEQIAMVDGATPSERLVELMHGCATLHKLGQVVARDRRLDEGFRRKLQLLELMEPRVPFSELEPVIRGDLAEEIAEFDIQMGDGAIAQGSVAVVAPMRWLDPEDGARKAGVLKVLKPGVRERMGEELVALTAAAEVLDGRRDEHELPALDYDATFRTVRELLGHEVLLDEEQAHLAEAAQLFRRWKDVHVPALLPFGTPNITAMERVDGVKVTDVLGWSGPSRRRLGRTIVRALIAQPMFSRASAALFHADGHAGNLLADADGRLVLLDWSLAGRLSKECRTELAQLVVGAIMLDARRLAGTLDRLAVGIVDEPVLRSLAEEAVAEVQGGAVPGPSWLTRILDRAAGKGVRFGDDLLLFRKTLFTATGVVGDVSDDCDLETVLISAAMDTFAHDMPRRAFESFDSHDFGTHLSNADLMNILWSSPQTAAKFWGETWRDWLKV